MTINESVKYNVKELRRNLKLLSSKQEKVIMLKAYLNGINDSIGEKVQKSFDELEECGNNFYINGYHLGTSYSVFERDSAKEAFNKQISKLIKKLERKSLLKQFYDCFGKLPFQHNCYSF